jgi:hypothetical protein
MRYSMVAVAAWRQTAPSVFTARTVGGRKMACIVINSVSGCGAGDGLLSPSIRTYTTAKRTFWIDDARQVIVKMRLELDTTRAAGEMAQAKTFVDQKVFDITYPVVKLEEPLHDSDFVFTPPKNAMRVKAESTGFRNFE